MMFRRGSMEASEWPRGRWKTESAGLNGRFTRHHHIIYLPPPHLIILATLSRTAILDTKPGGKPDDHTSTKVARSVIPTHQEEQGCRSKSSRRMLLGGTVSDKIVSRISYSSPGMGTRCSQYCGLHLVIHTLPLELQITLHTTPLFKIKYVPILSPISVPPDANDLHIMTC